MKYPVLTRLAALLVLLLLTVPLTLPANGEEDLSYLTDEVVLPLPGRVNEEVASRGLRKTATPAKGKYIAGQQLPVGFCLLTSLAKGDDRGNLTICSADRKQKLRNVLTAPDEGEDPETVFITLEEGDELKSDSPSV